MQNKNVSVEPIVPSIDLFTAISDEMRLKILQTLKGPSRRHQGLLRTQRRAAAFQPHAFRHSGCL